MIAVKHRSGIASVATHATMRGVSVEHYENFPVASWLCPPAMRPAVVAIYRFARTADDLADEGEAPAEARREQLARYRQALQSAAAGQLRDSDWPQVFGPLAEALRRHALPLPLLQDLLDAFEQDTHNPRYADRGALLDYCRRSANPVGRLLLHLAGVGDETSLRRSDDICSALQLINFWQDPSVDLPRGRHYIPEADAARHGLTLDGLARGVDSAASAALLRELCDWAAALMQRGAPLALQLPGRLGWELRLVVQGGLRILAKIAALDHRTLARRPVIGTADALPLLWSAWRMGHRSAAPGLALPR
ncbi:MAG: squalene synthase HpnC [Burkholderiaceae bacterium]|nr:squalene synthase HpnC [Burkholderiaceae bacterium]